MTINKHSKYKVTEKSNASDTYQSYEQNRPITLITFLFYGSLNGLMSLRFGWSSQFFFCLTPRSIQDHCWNRWNPWKCSWISPHVHQPPPASSTAQPLNAQSRSDNDINPKSSVHDNTLRSEQYDIIMVILWIWLEWNTAVNIHDEHPRQQSINSKYLSKIPALWFSLTLTYTWI